MISNTIELGWFEDYIAGWSRAVQWSPEQRERIQGLLAEISVANGGRVVAGSETSVDERAAYAILRADDAIQRQMNMYARSRAVPQQKFYARSTAGDRDILPFLTLKELAASRNINRMSLEELDALPGVGKVTGQRIIDARESRGPFRDIEELLTIDGISTADLSAFRDQVTVGEANPPVYRFAELDHFVAHPSFSTYIDLLESGGSFSQQSTPKQDEPLSVVEAIVNELEEIRHSVAQSPSPIARTSALASEALEELAVRNAAHTPIQTKGAVGRILFDRQYRPFLEALLETCERSLDIAMFFFRFIDDGAYVTDRLVDLIVACHDKGARVRVIIDVDQDEDPYDSDSINSEIFQYLREREVPVVLDEAERVTHSKLIIVDDRHVVVGSHNWTAGSFYVYDDVSLYVDSEAVGANYAQHFSKLWKKHQ